MAYTINKTNGAVLTTVSDGTVDDSTSLKLVGRNYSGYGEIFNENYVRLLENFSNTTAPTSPLSGQLWWDSTTARLKAYTGSIWKNVQASYTGTDVPTAAVVGDLWWNNTDRKLKVATAPGVFADVGGPGTASAGSIVEISAISDTTAATHQVVRFMLDGVTVAIISRDATFTPNPAIVGFATIVPGMNLSTAVSGIQLTGKSSNADLLDNIDSAGFMRKNITETTTGELSVLNDTGINVGVNRDFNVSVFNSDVTLRNRTLRGDLNLVVNVSGAPTIAVNVDGVTGDLLPGSNNRFKLGTTATKWNEVHASNFIGGTNTQSTGTNNAALANTAFVQNAVANSVNTTGDQTIGGVKTFSDVVQLSSNRLNITNATTPMFEMHIGGVIASAWYVQAGSTRLAATGGNGNISTVHLSIDTSSNLTASGNVTAFSDIRLKTDITKITDALAKVNQLNGYTYTRIDTGERQTGVVAQELQKVLPEAVMDDGETLSVAYGNMMGLMIEAVKELTARVKEFEAR